MLTHSPGAAGLEGGGLTKEVCFEIVLEGDDFTSRFYLEAYG